ncbi:MAG: OstA-like protein [Bacteroidales bacterium]
MKTHPIHICAVTLLAIISLVPLIISAQEPTIIQLIKADFQRYDRRIGVDVQRLIGNVILKQDSTYLHCDSAYLYEATNSFDGFGNVWIKVSDSLNIYSTLLQYDGNTKLAELHQNVRLVDKQSTLYTEHLWYDRNTRIAYYKTGGKIVDTANVLTSTVGYYFTDQKRAYFRDDVKLVNPDYEMVTDTMLYHTNTEVSEFFGPTSIISEENLIYCENGWYDTRNDIAQFSENAYILTREQKLEGDSIYYDRNIDFGKALKNVILSDTVQEMVVYGQYGEFTRSEGFAFVTDSAVAVLIDRVDSLFLHSDSLFIYFDSTQQVQSMAGYYHAKFFRNDMQGMCDSLIYNFADSTIFLYKQPVLWSDENQLTADSIRIAMANNQVDTLALLGNAFIISMDDTISRETFNQIKGKVMTGYFSANKLVKIVVIGNSETVYYVREEDGSLIGINLAYSSDMQISLRENKIETITYITMPDAQLYPYHEFPQEKQRLRDFIWLEPRRPKNKDDIFVW